MVVITPIVLVPIVSHNSIAMCKEGRTPRTPRVLARILFLHKRDAALDCGSGLRLRMFRLPG